MITHSFPGHQSSGDTGGMTAVDDGGDVIPLVMRYLGENGIDFPVADS